MPDDIFAASNPYQAPEAPVAHARDPHAGDDELKYAPLWRRLCAFLIDGVIAYALVVVPLLVLGSFAVLLRTFAMAADAPPWAPVLFSTAMAMVLWYCAVVNYFVLMESSRRQATLGKLLFQIRVATTRGRRLSLGSALVRTLGKTISLGPCGIGALWIPFSKRKQAMHDHVAGTVVLAGSVPAELGRRDFDYLDKVIEDSRQHAADRIEPWRG